MLLQEKENERTVDNFTIFFKELEEPVGEELEQRPVSLKVKHWDLIEKYDRHNSFLRKLLEWVFQNERACATMLKYSTPKTNANANEG